MVEKLLVEQTEERKTNNEIDSLREYSLEADLVGQLQKHQGWGIIERDLNQYKNEISANIAYLNTKSKEFQEARILYIAADKLLSLFRDYDQNRKRALELLDRIDNTQENIILDVDN